MLVLGRDRDYGSDYSATGTSFQGRKALMWVVHDSDIETNTAAHCQPMEGVLESHVGPGLCFLEIPPHIAK